MAKKRGSQRVLDRLAVVFFVLTLGVCVCDALLLALPTQFNPLAAPTRIALAKKPPPTLAPTNPPPSATPTASSTPRATNTPVVGATTPSGPTNTPRPTITRPPTRTPTPTWGPSPTPSPTRSKFPFTAEIVLQPSPYGCNWAGVAGVVFDLEGKPLVGYIVHVQGDADIDRTVLSGSSQFKGLPQFGESSWDVPINASGMVAGGWQVRLYQPGTNKPISDVYDVRLQAACGSSFAFIKFVQNH